MEHKGKLMKTHLMVKRNWFVCMFTKYKYYMACNSKRKFKRKCGFFDKHNIKINAETEESYYISFLEDDCQNCTRTKYYKENK